MSLPAGQAHSGSLEAVRNTKCYCCDAERTTACQGPKGWPSSAAHFGIAAELLKTELGF